MVFLWENVGYAQDLEKEFDFVLRATLKVHAPCSTRDQAGNVKPVSPVFENGLHAKCFLVGSSDPNGSLLNLLFSQ